MASFGQGKSYLQRSKADGTGPTGLPNKSLELTPQIATGTVAYALVNCGLGSCSAAQLNSMLGRTENVEVTVSDQVPASQEALDEALRLSSDILKDIELSQVPLANVALKAGRLARLLNDFDMNRMLQYEASGYPSGPEGIPQPIWQLLVLAGRTYQYKGFNAKEAKTVAFVESIEQLQLQIEASKLGLQAARDPDVSVSSANPNQYVSAPPGNTQERLNLSFQINTAAQRLASRRAFIHDYASRRYHQLRFSQAAEDVFSGVRRSVDAAIGDLVPTATEKFASVHDNLRSENPEDWSNAVHCCRRILQDLADALFPPRDDDRRSADGRSIKLGAEHYINRLVCFVEDHTDSSRFREIVGSHLAFLGDRLEAVFKAAQKGSHAIVARGEASRYVVYTYMVVGDILALRHESKPGAA